MRRSLAILLAAATAAASITPAAGAAGARASLTDIENDVMCTVCHESLAVAQSPEAQQERDFIRTLIAQGLDKAQIEHQLVLQYGPGVLGRPPAHGFNLTVYVLPPAILIAGIALLAFTLPRWRRRRPAAGSIASGGSGSGLSALDAQRLDDELGRFPG